MFETLQNPLEILKAELSGLVIERGNLEKSIQESGENIDVELGSEEYKDYGYTVRLNEVNERIAQIETALEGADDVDASQRKLSI